MYGPVGIFLMDIRGNRITGDGVQHSDNPLVSDQQWRDFGDKSFGRVYIQDTKAVIQMSSSIIPT